MASTKITARFISPMLLLRSDRLPEGPDWPYELKLDGYRALAIKTGGKVHLRSRNDNDFDARYPRIVKALASNLPGETVIDGEIVALDEDVRPCFNSLQNYECRWLKRQLVEQFEFGKWTEDEHLRHSRFVALRDDKNSTDVIRVSFIPSSSLLDTPGTVVDSRQQR